jgi:alanine-glyoxylate transaminase / serine-glyoxylate transaminase / serine-pyruvate transaminase
MKAYESGSALYFATPPVNLINAFHASLCQITKGSPTLEERFEQHRKASKQIKDAVAELGLKQLPLDPAHAANGMTAVSYFSPPEDIVYLMSSFSLRCISLRT